MEIAVGVIFLALFVGATFLFFLILGLFIWRRKGRNASASNRRFAPTTNYRSSRASNDLDDNDDYYNSAAYFAAASSSNSQQSQESGDANAGTNLGDSTSDKEVSAGISYDGATEGGDYASSGNDYSSNYDSSSGSSYDSGSGYDSSSSGGDSGSSSSSSD